LRDFTQGLVFRPLITFAVPIVVANLLQTFYNLVDTFWIGTPAGAANLLNALGGSLLLRLVTPYGTAAVAAHSVGVRLESLAVMPAVALGQAASNWAGQNLGAGKRDRAFRGAHAMVGTTFGLLAVLGSLAYMAAPRLVGVFAPGETEVIAFGTVYLHILSFSWALLGT